MPADVAGPRQYGTFSARYGNVYTAAQAEQLFRRAYGEFVPDERPWHRTDGALADPFRPMVEPDGFADVPRWQADRTAHLAAVRAVFEESDVLVFTLGLDRGLAVACRRCGLPTAPGVNAGDYDPDATYEFVNFDVDEVRPSCSSSASRPARSIRRAHPAHRVAGAAGGHVRARHVLVSTTSQVDPAVAADEGPAGSPSSTTSRRTRSSAAATRPGTTTRPTSGSGRASWASAT